MWADPVVVLRPLFDEHLRLLQRVEDFAVEQLVPEFAVERLVVSILPGVPRFDEQRPHADPIEPFPYGLCGELGAVVGPNMVWRAMPDEQVCQAMQYPLLQRTQMPSLSNKACGSG